MTRLRIEGGEDVTRLEEAVSFCGHDGVVIVQATLVVEGHSINVPLTMDREHGEPIFRGEWNDVLGRIVELQEAGKL